MEFKFIELQTITGTKHAINVFQIVSIEGSTSVIIKLADGRELPFKNETYESIMEKIRS